MLDFDRAKLIGGVTVKTEDAEPQAVIDALHHELGRPVFAGMLADAMNRATELLAAARIILVASGIKEVPRSGERKRE